MNESEIWSKLIETGHISQTDLKFISHWTRSTSPIPSSEEVLRHSCFHRCFVFYAHESVGDRGWWFSGVDILYLQWVTPVSSQSAWEATHHNHLVTSDKMSGYIRSVIDLYMLYSSSL